ncbi:MAG: hypothetical protein K0R75_822 [Paenibacillaceae bacterium]|jgi:hypothetical protein|nr:hypothetical protein [Paenibacillaceae bacterium]
MNIDTLTSGDSRLGFCYICVNAKEKDNYDTIGGYYDTIARVNHSERGVLVEAIPSDSHVKQHTGAWLGRRDVRLG